MLARGELQTIGRNHLDEYQQALEKDPRSARFTDPGRRPTDLRTRSDPQGLRDRYETHTGSDHDDGLVAAAQLADRYISDRFLPDRPST